MDVSASHAMTATGADVDALVARYAPLGRRLRKRRRLVRVALALLVPALAAGAIVAWQSGAGLVAGLLSGAAADRAELTHQQAQLREQRQGLAAELAALSAQREALAGKERELNARQAELARAVEQVEQQRRGLQASGGREADIERQLAEIARQKGELERQQRKFLEQGQALARELQEINAQRVAIERQRRAMEEQQAEVRRLLEQLNQPSASAQAPPARPASEPVAQAGDETAPGPMATLAAVDADTLGEVRGGINLGQDYTIAIGITRTTSINGIEQFASSMYLDDLATVAGTGVAQQMLDPVIIQNGAGNVVSADTLTSLSSSVATIIQNTMDNQAIANQTVMDISLQNVSTVTQGLQHLQAVGESLSRQP